MKEITFTKYIADDGTSFEDSLSCLQYEKLCAKYKQWLQERKVTFWSHSGEFMNPDLTNGTANYLDWLNKQLLNTCGYVAIKEHPCDKAWPAVWEFVVKYLNIDNSTADKLEPNYQMGDILAHDLRDCKFHNITFVARNSETIKKTLMDNLNQVVEETAK